MEAFYALSAGRPYISGGMGGAYPSSIPFDSVVNYARVYGPDDAEDFDRFWRILSAVDRVYVDLTVKKINEKSKANKSANKPKR